MSTKLLNGPEVDMRIARFVVSRSLIYSPSYYSCSTSRHTKLASPVQSSPRVSAVTKFMAGWKVLLLSCGLWNYVDTGGGYLFPNPRFDADGKTVAVFVPPNECLCRAFGPDEIFLSNEASYRPRSWQSLVFYWFINVLKEPGCYFKNLIPSG